MREKNKQPNRLIREKSPYLLQHAYNPVQWHPWGAEAFDEARKNDKPIFLSIGYASCHWCHVMESESFEDFEVADLMNDLFVNIKVDREELPEVDSLYMEFAQGMMLGAAGWPLNVILTPDLQPFCAVTYLPPRATDEMMGLVDLIKRIAAVWYGGDKEKIVEQAAKVVAAFDEHIHSRGSNLPESRAIDETAALLYQLTDPIYGGMEGAPKFPIAYHILLLIHYSAARQDSRALFLAERTLDMMQRGGIYDHLGGGFSRYSVDHEWRIPHFEKMLSDNALLSQTYLEAWKLTKRELYRNMCEETIDFVLRDMALPEGGFISGIDADSGGKEGGFYTWTPKEASAVLSPEDAALFCDLFHVSAEGDIEGRSVLRLGLREDEYAAEKNIDSIYLNERLKYSKTALREAREKRPLPVKDSKLICAWNGLMIHTLAAAGASFQNTRYTEKAVQAAQFIQAHLWNPPALLRRWCEGEGKFSGGLEDYAFLIRGLLTLFEVGQGTRYLEWALQLTNHLSDYYKDPQGAFFQTDGKDPSIILRNCQFSDGSEPSGNAVHCENLLRLYQLTYEPRYLEEAKDIFRAVEKYLEEASPGYTYHVLNLQRFYNKKTPTLIVALNETNDFYKEIHQKIFKAYIPHLGVVWRPFKDDLLFESAPFVKGQAPYRSQTTLYLCYDRVCEKPLTDIHEILAAIENL